MAEGPRPIETDLPERPGPLAGPVSLLSILLLTLAVAAAMGAGRLWPVLYRAYVSVPVLPLALLAAAVVLGVLGPARMRRWAFNLCLSALLTAIYLSATVPPLGDHDLWLRIAQQDHATVAELLANVTYRLARLLHVHPYLVPPAFGFLAALAYLTTVDEVLADRPKVQRPRAKALCSVLYIASGVQAVFFRGYVENTQLAVPFLLTAICLLLRYVRRSGAGLDLMIIPGAGVMTLAALFHGQDAFLLPGLLFAAAVRRLPARECKGLAGDVLLAGLTVAVVGGGTLDAVRAAGFVTATGNVHWQPGSMFVALWRPLAAQDDFTMFSFDHLLQVANIVAVVFPAFPLAAITLVALPARSTSKPESLLAVLALGYLAFAFLWNFSLGFPNDYDLMISLSTPLVLFLSACTVRLSQFAPKAAWAMVAVNLAYSWATICLLLR